MWKYWVYENIKLIFLALPSSAFGCSFLKSHLGVFVYRCLYFLIFPSGTGGNQSRAFNIWFLQLLQNLKISAMLWTSSDGPAKINWREIWRTVQQQGFQPVSGKSWCIFHISDKNPRIKQKQNSFGSQLAAKYAGIKIQRCSPLKDVLFIAVDLIASAPQSLK